MESETERDHNAIDVRCVCICILYYQPFPFSFLFGQNIIPFQLMQSMASCSHEAKSMALTP